MWKFIITMAPPTKTLAAPGKPSPPHQVGPVSLGSLHCVHCKKTGRFCSQIHQEKSIFECTIGARRFVGRLCHFPFKRVQQWPSMPMAMIACCFSTNEFLLEIHMVSGVMLVKGYSMRQQSAVGPQD
jgi:hypothetical protein